jgi:CoA-disulfide reductase
MTKHESTNRSNIQEVTVMNLKLVIIGGVAGGASAAARARRIDENAEIIVFEKGEHVSFANCGLPYYIGDEIRNRDDLLVTTPDNLRKRFRIDVRTFSEVLAIDRDNKQVQVKNHKTGETYYESYDKLILSPGASPVIPPVPGIDLKTVFTMRNIPDTDEIKDFIRKNKPRSAVIVGGGFIGIEMAENLSGQGLKVTIIEMLDQVMTSMDYEMASIIHSHLRDSGVELRFNEEATGFRLENNKTFVKLKDDKEIATDMVILSIGVKPDSMLAVNTGLKTGVKGAIITNDRMQTSDPHIYAVGDAVQVTDFVSGQPVHIPLAGPANRQGRIAADNALGRDVTYKGTQGTSIVKIFDITAASTGMNEKTLKSNSLPYLVSYSNSGSHASYYPGAQRMTVKVIFSPDTGRLLGAQIVGMKGTDKRIDVLATAIRGSMTVFDLEELELAYAPPFSSAKDPVNMAGFIAGNMLKGDLKTVNWNEIKCLKDDKYQFLDVREDLEVKLTGLIGNAVHIPINDLRDNLDRLDKTKKIIIYCASGLRSYIGHRILSQNGFDSFNLSGGYNLYEFVKKENSRKTQELCQNEQPEENEMDVKETDVNNVKPDYEVNACGLQCPGPIMKLKEQIDRMNEGQLVSICAAEAGFKADVGAWCKSTGNHLLSLVTTSGIHSAMVKKGTVTDNILQSPAENTKKKTIIVFSNDLDKAMASFIIANGAASMGNEVVMFFTFWGLNLLRKKNGAPVKKDFLSKMFGAMMPKGPDKTALSKMHMGGMGTGMMRYVMNNRNVDSLEMLMHKAREQGVRFVACTMSMDVMGIKKEELIDGVEEAGVAAYLYNADQSNMNLFI